MAVNEKLRRKADSTIRAELKRIRDALKRDDLTESARSELYGAHQALCWARGENAMAPEKSALV